MNERLNWVLPSFEMTRIGSLRIRLSLWFLPILPLFPLRFGWTLGMAVLGVLIVSLFLHELGHVLFARITGGTASEIHISPFGGLATVQAGRGIRSQLLTTAAGPLMNLIVCTAVFPGYYMPETLWRILNPLEFPLAKFGDERLLAQFGLVVFAVNWILFVVNSLPILPLDGGRIVRTLLLTRRIHPELIDRYAIQFSMVMAGVLSLAGLYGNWAMVVFLAAGLFMINMVQFFEHEAIDREEESFLGYDFSEGYTSLDRSAPPTAGNAPAASQRSLLEQWRERRRQQREQAIRRQQEEAERQLDDLLAKVHAHGMGSLTSREQQLLKQVSDLLRERGKRPT